MSQARELARLNLVLELVSACAGLVSADDIVRLIPARLRWILEFDTCRLVIRRSETLRCFSMTLPDAGMAESELPREDSVEGALILAALTSGAPSSSGLPMNAVAYPLGHAQAVHGVLCLTATAPFTRRELRLIHHISASLGAVLFRIEQEEIIDQQRRAADAAAATALAEKAASDEAAAAKDAFIAMLGHELRNPLAPILMATRLLSREVEGKPLTRVGVIERQARHLDRLVSDLLDVSRITNGKISLQRAAVDFGDVIDKAAEMARPGMDAKGQQLEVLRANHQVMVNGDEVRLAQVLSNLLNNASTYSGAGKTIRVRLDSAAYEAVLQVEDDGIGMSAGTLGKVFEFYVQGKQSKEWSPGGLGLGLAVSRALVELHGGRIEAQSAGEGSGSRFTVRLPLFDDVPATVVSTPEPSREGARQLLRILVVDDNVDAADSLADLLVSEGHQVRVAYHPNDALRAAASFQPQIGILDIGLPVMDGHELAAELRKLPGSSSTKFFALSGYAQDADKERSRRSGFEAHFVKPANAHEILSALQQA